MPMGRTTCQTRNGSAPSSASNWFSVSAANMEYLKKPRKPRFVTTQAATASCCCRRVAPGRVITRPQMKSITVVNSIKQTNHGSHQP
jgi:hypothetical protein